MYPRKLRAPVEKLRGRAKKIFSSEYFLLKTASNGLRHNRFSIIIPASSVRSSAKRHFWKRRIADYLKNWPNFKKDFLFIISPKIETISVYKLEEEIARALEAARS